MRRTPSLHAGTALLFLLVSTETAGAQPGFVYSIDSKSFVTMDVGLASLGANDIGQIVGVSPTDGSLPNHGFIKDRLGVTSFDYPGAYYTAASGINNSGQIAGTQCTWSSGPVPYCSAFLKNGNAFTSYDYPGALFTYGNAINSAGQIVGAYRVQIVVGPNSVQDFDHGLLIHENGFTSFDFPGAYSTVASGINDAGQVVGTYVQLTNMWPGFRYRGFLRDRDSFSTIDYPDVFFTFVAGINNSGQVAGSYEDRYGYRHGFVASGGSFKSFDIPGADTFPSGINNLGEIVGTYSPRPVVQTIAGFIAIVDRLGMANGPTTSLRMKLNSAIVAFETGDFATACADVQSFIGQAKALGGKKLTPIQADGLLASAAQIQAMLGCR